MMHTTQLDNSCEGVEPLSHKTLHLEITHDPNLQTTN
jgi:hypothetical protein